NNPSRTERAACRRTEARGACPSRNGGPGPPSDPRDRAALLPEWASGASWNGRTSLLVLASSGLRDRDLRRSVAIDDRIDELVGRSAAEEAHPELRRGPERLERLVGVDIPLDGHAVHLGHDVSGAQIHALPPLHGQERHDAK